MTSIKPEQLAFPVTAVAEAGVDAVVVIARAAVSLDLHPGYAAFTTGKIAVKRADAERIVLRTDSPWAASAIRTRLLGAGCAVEGDPAHEATTVAVWPTGHSSDTDLPALPLTEEQDAHGRTTVLLDGPHGTVEQQLGNGGHNDLIVHARHPFPSAVRTDRCARHGDCWMRSQSWPHASSPRRHIHTVVTDVGYRWDVTAEAGKAMRAVYLEHVHQTRPDRELSIFRVVLPALTVAETPHTDDSSPVAIAPALRVADVIRDLADYAPAS